MLNLIFVFSLIVLLMSVVSTSWGGGRVANAGALYKQDRRNYMSSVLNNKVRDLYKLRSEGMELKDKSAKSIFDYNNNSGVDWNDLNSAEKSQYEFLSQHIQSDDFKNGSK